MCSFDMRHLYFTDHITKIFAGRGYLNCAVGIICAPLGSADGASGPLSGIAHVSFFNCQQTLEFTPVNGDKVDHQHNKTCHKFIAEIRHEESIS